MANSPIFADHRRMVRPMLVAIAALVAGVLALGLLKTGFGVAPAFGIAGGVMALVLAWRRLIRFAGSSCRSVVRFAVAMIRSVFDRRTYRFRLSTLLLTMAIIAAVCAWYSYRLHAERLETRRLARKWRMLNSQGEPHVVNGKLMFDDFEQAIREGRCTIDPVHDPKWIDFKTPTGTKRGIYRWEGKRLRMAQASEYHLRPTSFDPKQEHHVDPTAPPIPGGAGRVGWGHWIFEPAVEENSDELQEARL